MIELLKAIALYIIELNLFFMIGTLIGRLPFLRSLDNPFANILYGFAAYHCLFWCIAYVCKLRQLPVTIVYFAWLSVLLIIPVVLFIAFSKKTLFAYARLFRECKDNIIYLLPALFALVLVTFYSVTHGQIDLDSVTYIGEISTYLHTDSMTAFDIGTGLPAASGLSNLRRDFSLFGVESACWCRLLSLHPLIYCRCTRAALNFAVYAASLFSCARIWRPAKDAFLFVTAAFSFLPLFTLTIFQQGTFLLHRGYEGKAWLAGCLISMMFYFAVMYSKTGKDGWALLLLTGNIACLNVSGSSVFVIPALIFPILFVNAFASLRVRSLAYMFLIFAPNCWFLLQYIMS